MLIKMNSQLLCKIMPVVVIVVMTVLQSVVDGKGYACRDQSQSLDAKCFQSAGVKDGAYFCYCVYVLCILRYSGFLWVVLTNTGILLRGLKLYRESRT